MLKFLFTSEGRIAYNATNDEYEFIYDVKDYLGNTRVSFKPTAARNEIMQEDHYYPFGMKMAGLSRVTGSPETKFTYNGKELEDDFNLNWYHYGARYYDPQLGRWQQVDPVQEFHSPYLFCHNDPIKYVDPDGADDSAVIAAKQEALAGFWETVMDFFYGLDDWAYQETVSTIEGVQNQGGLEVEGTIGPFVVGVSKINYPSGESDVFVHAGAQVGVGLGLEANVIRHTAENTNEYSGDFMSAGGTIPVKTGIYIDGGASLSPGSEEGSIKAGCGFIWGIKGNIEYNRYWEIK